MESPVARAEPTSQQPQGAEPTAQQPEQELTPVSEFCAESPKSGTPTAAKTVGETTPVDAFSTGDPEQESTPVNDFNTETPVPDNTSEIDATPVNGADTEQKSETTETPKKRKPKLKTNYFRKAVGKYILVSMATRKEKMVSLVKREEVEKKPEDSAAPKTQLERAIAANPDAAMQALQKYYREEQEHIRGAVDVYSSLKNDLQTITADFKEQMEEAKKFRLRKEFKYEYKRQIPQVLFAYTGASRRGKRPDPGSRQGTMVAEDGGLGVQPNPNMPKSAQRRNGADLMVKIEEEK